MDTFTSFALFALSDTPLDPDPSGAVFEDSTLVFSEAPPGGDEGDSLLLVDSERAGYSTSAWCVIA
ncbi:hypothetical protein HGRIS_007137 [Hohenbuehelia grisea]|uniref:Pheromone n=1 Tax=Hohenbuehelia grisea TaxID=104357 RepID=A0ABR3JBQ9_9AGAR